MSPLKHIWSFLVKERALGGPVVPRSRRKRNVQRGVALVTALIAIALAFVISNQFGTTTNVDLIGAANYRDKMRSHFLAKSASNLSELVIRIQQRLDNVKQLAGMQITDFADQVLLAFCGSSEEVQAAVGFSSSEAKGLGADIGSCGIVGQITTEDDKLNLNCANGNAATAQALYSALAGLVYFPAYDPLFEEADAEGYRRDRALQVSSIVDYIDSDSLRNTDKGAQRGTTEDYGYESLKDPYKPKNNYLDTVGEAKLARGVDDRFWELFGHAFTVYGGCKTNLSALSNPQLIAGILMLAAKNQNDPILQDPQKLFALAGIIAKAKQFGMTFTAIPDFIDFVKDPAAQLGSLAGSNTQAGSAASAAVNAGIPGLTGGQKLGMELNETLLKQIATVGPRRTYRVEAWGEIERKQKNADGSPVYPPIRTTLTGVWDTKTVLQNVRKPPVPKGAWVYLRED